MKRIISSGSDKSAELLINSGADISIKDKNGKTARDYAEKRGKIMLQNRKTIFRKLFSFEGRVKLSLNVLA